jgi:hypothetical protein
MTARTIDGILFDHSMPLFAMDESPAPADIAPAPALDGDDMEIELELDDEGVQS